MSKKVQQPKVPQQPLYTVDVKFDRSNATYKPQQFVTGNISLLKRKLNNFSVDVSSMKFTVSGKARLQNRHNKKIIQELLQIAQKIVIINQNVQVCQQKTINQSTALPFRFKLSKQAGNDNYLQSYVGVYLSVIYEMQFDIKFVDPSLQKIKSQIPFYVQVPNAGRQILGNFQYPRPRHFLIRSEDIKNQMAKTHPFQIRCELQSDVIIFSDYVLGKFIIDMAQSPIRSIDLQMLRNQKAQFGGKMFNEITQIQLIQLCDGDISRNMQLPIYMILPRYYSCPSIHYKWFIDWFQRRIQSYRKYSSQTYKKLIIIKRLNKEWNYLFKKNQGLNFLVQRCFIWFIFIQINKVEPSKTRLFYLKIL